MPDTLKSVKLEVKNLKKDFDRKTILRDLNFSLANRDSLSITGKNGSGKSTLIKILSNIFMQTSGSVNITVDDTQIERPNYYRYIGLISPYLNLYDEFSGLENLRFTAKLRGLDEDCITSTIKRVGLWERRNDLVKIYSSGMKQRLKLAFALMHDPEILLLDEPTSNLDAEGVQLVDKVAEEYKLSRILIIATNDEHERSLCKSELNLDGMIKNKKS
jgi:heme exporter protein A